MTKEQKIKFIVDLLKGSDLCYVDNLYELLINDDLTFLPKFLGDDDWEALKTMIELGDIE